MRSAQHSIMTRWPLPAVKRWQSWSPASRIRPLMITSSGTGLATSGVLFGSASVTSGRLPIWKVRGELTPDCPASRIS